MYFVPTVFQFYFPFERKMSVPVISSERGRRALNRIKVRKHAATQKVAGRDENVSLRIRSTSHLG